MRRSVLVLAGLLWGASVQAAAPLLLDAAQDPSAELAAHLSDLMVAALPEGSVSVLYRDCQELVTCAGQLPDWFSHPAWLRAIERSALSLVPLESTVGQTTLNRIHQTLPGQASARTDALLDELQYARNVTVLLVVRPVLGVEPQVQWSVYDIQTRAVQAQGALRYRLSEAAPLPSPLVTAPVLSPAVTALPPAVGPDPERQVSWLGVGVGLAGAAAVGWSLQQYRSDPTVILTTGDAARIRNPIVLLNTVGWVGLASGTVLVTLPVVRSGQK